MYVIVFEWAPPSDLIELPFRKAAEIVGTATEINQLSKQNTNKMQNNY